MELFKHNQEIFDTYKSMRKTHKNILVVQGTGLGKTPIAIKVIETYFKDKPVLYVVPKKMLKNSVKDNKYWNFNNVKFACYHSLKNHNPEDYSLCVLDEVHRSGAPTWIKEAKRFINSNTCHVLGLTATAIRMDGINIAKKVFNEDDVIYGLSIFEAIDQGILPKPNYVCAELEPEETIKYMEKSLNKCNAVNRKIVTEKLKVIKDNDLNEYKLENIIPKYSNGSNKFIIFTPSIEDCNKWIKRFKHILHTDKVFGIHSNNPKDYNEVKMDYFNKYNDKDNIAIIGVDMLIEGWHIDNVSQIIMLRNTNSYPLYIQMLGRVLSCANKNITPVVYDLHKNCEISECVEYDSYSTGYTDNTDTDNTNSDRIKNHVNIVKDYSKDFNEIARYISNKIIWTDEMINDIKNLDLSNPYIAKKYGISTAAVCIKRNSLGIKSRYSDNKIIWTDEMINDINNSDLSGKSIAKKYGISTTAVSDKRESLGIKRHNRQHIHKVIWTDEMISDIKNFDLIAKYIAKKYGISTASVFNKRESLGIKTGYGKIIWTDEMIIDIKNFDLSNTYISKKYGISLGSVKSKRESLGIKSRYSDNKIIWTDELINDIKNSDLSGKSIAKKYGISRSAIFGKRESLGIKSRYSYGEIIWTDEMINDIKNIDLSNPYIAKKYGISTASVCIKRNSLGIKSRYIKNIWTDELINDIKNSDLSHTYISKKYNISYGAVNRKRKELGIVSKYSKNKSKK